MHTFVPHRGGGPRRPGAAAGSRSPFLLCLALLAAGSSASTASAQGPPRLVVSTSSDLAPGGALGAVSDAGLLAVGAGGSAVQQFTENHWLAQAGFVPSDVDAFARLESFPEGSARSFVFSLQANQGSFLDGDALTFDDGGGVSILYGEDALLAGLGIPGGNVDVDALDLDPLGRLVFSLQGDVSGTLLGTVQDGDVLRLEFDGSVSLLASEQEVQTSFSVATGLADAIGDVQGLTLVGTEIWVAIQAPSSHDGGVLALGTAARMVYEEDLLGIGGEELDALSVARSGDELACLTASTLTASAGESVHFEVYGAPGEVYLVLKAGGAGFFAYPGFHGYGGFYLDPLDPWLSSVVADPTDAIIVLDGAGRFAIDFALPTVPLWGAGWNGVDGWSFQLLSAAGEVSAPLRIELP